MKSYRVFLQSEVSQSFRCVRAANSLDIDAEKKSVHQLEIEADLETPCSVGLILGASGSGKTTLSRPVIDQLPESMSYDECAAILSGVGLTSVPCWIRPAHTLSNGQRARAEAALAMVSGAETTVIDEWTSVVDRTVAKVMSHCVQKFARRQGKKLILLSCHYDVVEWLDPDWIIDCNTQKFIDRRLLPAADRARREQLSFDIREVAGRSWKAFSRYHYLSENLPGGIRRFFGIFHGKNQIGFQCFANYTPRKDKNEPLIMHSNRTVIHPDYAGLGLGIRLINETSELMHREGFRVMAKFSSTPVYRSMSRQPCWVLRSVDRPIGSQAKRTGKGYAHRTATIRTNLKVYSFEYLGARAVSAPETPGEARTAGAPASERADRPPKGG
jgi:ABC-type ATPase involved in cell division/GNAT superfamily N-acetyltransferase